MVSSMRTQGMTTCPNAVIEVSTSEAAPMAASHSRNLNSLHTRPVQQEGEVFDDIGLPPPSYEETESRSIMPNEYPETVRARRGSWSPGTRHTTHHSSYRNDGGQSRQSYSSGVTLPSPKACRAILVLGTTGAGKSSFIAAASGLPVPIGHNLGPGTMETQSWTYTGNDKSTVTLIDTPGLSDLKRPDTEILTSVINYICQRRLQITAVVYLHRITERKLTGSAILNLRILRQICGDHFIPNVVLATSMWEAIPTQELDQAVEREVQFNTSPAFWGDMMKKGAEYVRWDERGTIGTAKTAKEIIRICERQARNTAKLNILLEMEDNCKVEDTSAYRILADEARKRLEQERRDMLEEQEEENRERELRRQKAELQAIAAREQHKVNQALENLEHVERSSHSIFPSLSSVLRAPMQRRFSDVSQAGRSRDYRDESFYVRERERERDDDHESDRERSRRYRRRGRSPGWSELIWVRRRRP